MIPINAWVIQTREEADNILLQGGKIIIMTEDVPDYLNYPHYGTTSLMANCLLPNYEAVSHYINGDYPNFSRVYNECLMYPESVIYFTTMISAMLNNIPLGFVFGTEEIEQVATVEFLNHFALCYGIHLGHIYPFCNQPPNNGGWMERRFSGANMTLLYTNNLLTAEEYLYVFPHDMKIDPQTMQKLVFELRPPVADPTNYELLEGYFNTVRKQIKQANRVLVDPMMMA